MIGLVSGRVALALVHEESTAEYAQAIRRLNLVVAGLAVVEHIGSTAVPGLVAKPIVDIAVGWLDEASLEQLIHGLQGLAYRYRGFRDDAGGHIADYVVGGVTRHHVHLLAYESQRWKRFLAFRDYLRDNAAARLEYARFKEELAARFPTDRRSYRMAKRDFVESMTDDACAWFAP